jgi:hypothetical protein
MTSPKEHDRNKSSLIGSDIVVEKIREKIDRVASWSRQARFSPDFKAWHRDTSVLLERAFGKESDQLNSFNGVKFSYNGIYMLGDQAPHDRRFRSATGEAIAILESIINEVKEFGISAPLLNNERNGEESFNKIEKLLGRFHVVARQLRQRYADRPTIDIVDEYDVQDVLHILLKTEFDDIRAEEYTPSYAGSSSRVDFLIKDHSFVIEAKMVRRGLGSRQIGEELLVDIGRYQQHPDCRYLICFIYDPEGRLKNPAGIIRDLESGKQPLRVKVIISPQ